MTIGTLWHGISFHVSSYAVVCRRACAGQWVNLLFTRCSRIHKRATLECVHRCWRQVKILGEEARENGDEKREEKEVIVGSKVSRAEHSHRKRCEGVCAGARMTLPPLPSTLSPASLVVSASISSSFFALNTPARYNFPFEEVAGKRNAQVFHTWPPAPGDVSLSLSLTLLPNQNLAMTSGVKSSRQ